MADENEIKNTADNADTVDDEELEAQLAYENLKRKREAKRRKRILIIAIAAVVALVGIIIFVAGQSNEASEDTESAAPVTGTVYKGDFATTVNASGATEPVNSTVVTPEVDGIIENLSVQEGSVVNQGDVLFTLKNESLDKAVRDANTQLQSAQRSADSANRAVDDAYAAYNRAVDEGNATGDWSTFDESGLKASITSAEDAYQSALASVETARSALNEATATADKRTVRAPVSGTIVSMSAQNGAAFGSVTGGSSSASSTGSGPLIQISDLSKMKVTVQVNEIDISNISVGQQAKATFSALPGVELSATVERIASVSSGAADSTGGGGGVVTYAVDLVIPEPDPNLKPGMTATVTITTQSVTDTLIVPVAALMEEPAENGGVNYHVTVLTDAEKGEQHDVAVQVVEKNNSEAAVTGELNDGDQVLLTGGAGASSGEPDAGAEMAA